MRSRFLLLPTLIVTTLASCQSADSTTPNAAANTPAAAMTYSAVPATTPIAAIRTQDGDLDEEAARIKRRRAQQAYLAEEYIKSGDAAFDVANLDGALVEYSNALQVMPSNRDVRDRMARVEAAMGNKYALAADALDNLSNRASVKAAQAMMAAEDANRRGNQALRAGEFDEAINQYRQAELILGYHPLVSKGTLTSELVKQNLSSARAMREEARAQAAVDREVAAAQASADATTAEQSRKRSQVEGLYSDAHVAFSRESFDAARDLCDQILGLDPGNRHAIKMRNLAVSADHKKAIEENSNALREEWQKTMDDLNQMGLIQTDSVVFNDLAYWDEVRDRSPIHLMSENVNAGSSRQAIRTMLDRTGITPRFGDADAGEGAPIEDVANFMQSLTGVNFIVTSPVLDDLDEEETSIMMTLPRMSVRKVLDLIADTSESLRWKIEDGVVKFVTIDQMTGGQVLELYAVSDLIRPIVDFPGKVINVQPSGGLEEPEEDIDEREALLLNGDDLDTLIRDNVSPETWEDVGASLRVTEAGVLVVNQTPDVHAKISELLDDLREATGIMVDIEARFLRVQDSFLEDIGVDFRGLGSPGLGANEAFNDFGSASAFADLGAEVGQDSDAGIYFDNGDNGDVKARIENLYDSALGNAEVKNSGGLSFQWTFLNDLQLEMILRAVQKAERIELVTAPHVLVANTARSNLTVTNQLAYVQDFNIEIAQGASIADPIIQTIQDGVVLDVRPTVSADRRFVTVEMRPTVAELKRPMKEITTTLASASSVTIQLPELEISRLRTTVPIPDGGTILLGGWKVHEEQNYNNGVPILNKIPIINFLFKREGNFVLNRKLLILLKATIVMWQEHQPTPAQLGVFDN
jgi:type II secretory pathway component GspD/PulD (secretin)